jgi:hypothetical protein
MKPFDDLCCTCGSGEPRYPLRDKYGFVITHVCDRCVKEKRDAASLTTDQRE